MPKWGQGISARTVRRTKAGRSPLDGLKLFEITTWASASMNFVVRSTPALIAVVAFTSAILVNRRAECRQHFPGVIILLVAYRPAWTASNRTEHLGWLLSLVCQSAPFDCTFQRHGRAMQPAYPGGGGGAEKSRIMLGRAIYSSGVTFTIIAQGRQQLINVFQGYRDGSDSTRHIYQLKITNQSCSPCRKDNKGHASNGRTYFPAACLKLSLSDSHCHIRQTQIIFKTIMAVN